MSQQQAALQLKLASRIWSQAARFGPQDILGHHLTEASLRPVPGALLSP